MNQLIPVQNGHAGARKILSFKFCELFTDFFTICFSSFLKQHSDEEAVFKSFRDINELIREMLELKSRHAAMDAELQEMHDRYSQMSLKFAEVEGERQKLRMTLKNVRASKKIVSSNGSSSDNEIEHSS